MFFRLLSQKLGEWPSPALILLLGLLVSCSDRSTPIAPVAEQTPAPAPLPRIIPCDLLTGAEVEAALGEALKSTKPSQSAARRYATAGCYFELQTPSNSIHVSVVQETADSPGIEQFWQETFPQEKLVDQERADGKISLAPRRIEGLGENAYWSSNTFTGTLYILQDPHVLMVSLGGDFEPRVRFERSEKIARLVLKKLPSR